VRSGAGRKFAQHRRAFCAARAPVGRLALRMMDEDSRERLPVRALALALLRALIGPSVSPNPHQALVTDHVLPGMQGLDLVRVVQRELPAVRWAVVNRYDAPKEARGMGVAWLLKPVDFDALVRLIEGEG